MEFGKIAGASIDAYETIKEDKRFTLFSVTVKTKAGVYNLFRRYSEFRDLYENISKAFPKEKLKFPPKKKLMSSNFDSDFLQSRQQALHDFIQKVLEIPDAASNPLVINFFFDTPRHGRGPKMVKTNEPYKPDTSETDGEAAIPFDLPEEAKKAYVKDFMMMKVIGKGSFGRVLLGKHAPTSTIYAIKVLSKEAIVKQNEVKHIMSERNVLLGNVVHPFLVGLHYSFQTPAKLYFVLDYVNGGELFFHLQQEKKFSIARSLFYSAEITSGIGFLHSRNVVYRDLKPENILLTQDGHIILTDFGLCKENVLPGQSTGTFCGTPEYLAPEVLKKHAYGRAVDWWCLGCVTYEMMCGLPPFYSRDVNEMYDRILHDTLRFPDHVPVSARAFIEALLIRIPDQRLGGGPKDAKDIMRHMFYVDIDWEKLDRKEVKPPYNPNVESSMDLKHIDPQFTQEPVPQSVMTESALNQVNAQMGSLRYDQFKGFSYQNKNDMHPGK